MISFLMYRSYTWTQHFKWGLTTAEYEGSMAADVSFTITGCEGNKTFSAIDAATSNWEEGMKLGKTSIR